MNLPYQGLATFLKSPSIGDQQFGFIGLPYDCSTSFRPGARFGPSAIRNASMMLTDGEHPVFNVDPAKYIIDRGDAAIISVRPEKVLLEIEKAVSSQTCHLLISGGDHLTTLGTLRALSKKHGKLGLVHFDSHCDCWSHAWGEIYGHGTFLRNAINEDLLDPKRVVSIGIRSPCDRVTRDWLSNSGGHTISMRDIGSRPACDIAYQIEKIVGTELPTFLTFDIDCLDPAYAPGTGTPEIGGMTTRYALDTIEALGYINFIGMDVVEVCPAYDHSQITALAAATLLWSYASMQTLF